MLTNGGCVCSTGHPELRIPTCMPHQASGNGCSLLSTSMDMVGIHCHRSARSRSPAMGVVLKVCT